MYSFTHQHIQANISLNLGGIRHIDFTLLGNKALYFIVNLRCFTSVCIITLSSLCLTSHLSLKSQCSLLHLQLKCHMSLSLSPLSLHTLYYIVTPTYPNTLWNMEMAHINTCQILSAIKTMLMLALMLDWMGHSKIHEH